MPVPLQNAHLLLLFDVILVVPVVQKDLSMRMLFDNATIVLLTVFLLFHLVQYPQILFAFLLLAFRHCLALIDLL